MGSRYVFWRTPSGDPYRGTDDKHAPAAVLARIGESASLNANGGISWPLSLGLHRLAVRSAAVVVDPDNRELNDTDCWSIVWKAINKEIKTSGGGKPVHPQALIKTANRLAATHFRQPVNDYVLLTALSVRNLPFKCITTQSCEISALPNRSSKYRPPEALSSRRGVDFLKTHLASSKYLTIKVKTKGRSPYEAYERALDAVNFLRGLWTFYATYGKLTLRIGGSSREPIGVIHVGPIHTLHYPDGSPAADVFWYEPDYAGDRKLFDPGLKWTAIEKGRQSAARKMRQHAYRQDIDRLIMRYALALDNANLDVAFLEMWSILEKVTDTVGGKYDETIERAIWVFKDRKTAKDLLKQLRFRRNQLVHAARSSDMADQVAYMVKLFIDPHLNRLIVNEFRVKSLKEYGEFVAMPTNVDTLTKRKDQIGRALRALS